MLVDYFEDYSYAYYMIGVGIAVSGFILTSILCFNKCEEKKEISKEHNLKDVKPSSATLQSLMWEKEKLIEMTSEFLFIYFYL